MGTRDIFVLSLAALILAPSFFAQQPSKEQFKLEGVVINTATGKPLPRALVQIAEHAMLTGPEGEFSFSGLPAGTELVRVVKPGYFTPGLRARQWSMGVNVEVGPGVGKVVLKLEPEAVITGRVTGEDDEPLEGVSIQVLTYISMNDGPQQLMPVDSGARTDEDGNYRIAGLPAGRYYVAARGADANRRVATGQAQQRSEAYPLLTYYPGTPDLAAAGAINLAPGQQTEVPFSLALTPAYRLAGTVLISGEWKQVHSPTLVDYRGQGLISASSFDAKSGAFEFRTVPAGTYKLRLSGNDLEDHTRFTDQKLVVARTASNLRLVLKPGVTVPVVVRTEFTKQPAGWCSTHDGRMVDCSDRPPVRIELISGDSPSPRFSTDVGRMQDPTALAIKGVPAGKYLVRTQVIYRGYVQSVRSGGVDLLREELTVPEGGELQPIEVVLRDDPATLSIKVRTERAGQEAMIVVFAEGALLPTPNLMSKTGSEVHFGVVPPGSYRVFAFDADDRIDTNPATLAKYAGKAARVTVSPNKESSITVDVIHVEE
jgi:Carboxypeptidase regulatory-like domain